MRGYGRKEQTKQAEPAHGMRVGIERKNFFSNVILEQKKERKKSKRRIATESQGEADIAEEGTATEQQQNTRPRYELAHGLKQCNPERNKDRQETKKDERGKNEGMVHNND
jgi:hypothetical protein